MPKRSYRLSPSSSDSQELFLPEACQRALSQASFKEPQLAYQSSPLEKSQAVGLFSNRVDQEKKEKKATFSQVASVSEVLSLQIPLTVSQLTRKITQLLEQGMGDVLIQGEISNYRAHASGHHYFTLKDRQAQLACLLFAREARALLKSPTHPLELRDGMSVQLQGKITVYQPRGQYQLVVSWIEPQGEGILRAQFEALKKKLEQEGLFSQESKRALPLFPQRIGVVTSTQGAALRDFLHVAHRRYPGLEVVVAPVRVQGEGAAQEIAAAIELLNQQQSAIGSLDLLVVTRGGGSLEDLWAFNEEVVARALAVSHLPTVSAVGHEIDVTIADFVADLRASTPSAAAELITAQPMQLQQALDKKLNHIQRELTYRFTLLNQRLGQLKKHPLFLSAQRAAHFLFYPWQQRLDEAYEALEQFLPERLDLLEQCLNQLKLRLQQVHPSARCEQYEAQLNYQRDRLQLLIDHRMELAEVELARLRFGLEGSNPKTILKRGFSITRKADGSLLRSHKGLKLGEKMTTQFAHGHITSEVTFEDEGSCSDKSPSLMD